MCIFMNKLVIPALLLGVVMVAGAFAFVPVGEAATVHDSISLETQAVGDAICSANLGSAGTHTANLGTGECEAVGEG